MNPFDELLTKAGGPAKATNLSTKIQAMVAARMRKRPVMMYPEKDFPYYVQEGPGSGVPERIYVVPENLAKIEGTGMTVKGSPTEGYVSIDREEWWDAVKMYELCRALYEAVVVARSYSASSPELRALLNFVAEYETEHGGDLDALKMVTDRLLEIEGELDPE